MKILCELSSKDEKALKNICGITAQKRYEETNEIKATPYVNAVRDALRYYSEYLEKNKQYK